MPNGSRTFGVTLTDERRRTLQTLQHLKEVLGSQGLAQNRQDLLAMKGALVIAKHQGLDSWEFPIVQELLAEYSQLLEKVRA